MKNNQNETESEDKQIKRSDEAELFAEILARMDARKAEEAPAMQVTERTSAPQTIDLIELFYYLLSKLHLILLGMIVGAVVMGFYASARVVPIYTATSKLYIMGTTGTGIMANLQIGTNLTMDYQEVFKTWEVHQMVNEELGTNYSYSTLQGMISVTNPEDTRVLYITASSTDAQMAAAVANAYATAAKKFIVQTMGSDEPSTFSIALVPGTSTSGSITSYVIRGMLLGTAGVLVILVMIFLLDNRPKSPEDIMHYANIPTLAVIPANPLLSGSKSHGKKARKT
jgi:capsular polysaccharide biosynthesis protein